jgi:hypothetical protein
MARAWLLVIEMWNKHRVPAQMGGTAGYLASDRWMLYTPSE